MDTSIKTPACCECEQPMRSLRNEQIDGAVGIVYGCRNASCIKRDEAQVTDWRWQRGNNNTTNLRST